VTPEPLIVSATSGLAVMVNALAPELNTIAFTSVQSEAETDVIMELSKVAVSVGLLGTVTGTQFSPVFQSAVTGLELQVALPA
jgi:hypothetical protein